MRYAEVVDKLYETNTALMMEQRPSEEERLKTLTAKLMLVRNF